MSPLPSTVLFNCGITSYHELEPKAFRANMLFYCLQWGISTGRRWHLNLCLVFLNILSSQTDKSPNFIVYHAIVTFAHIVCSVRAHQQIVKLFWGLCVSVHIWNDVTLSKSRSDNMFYRSCCGNRRYIRHSYVLLIYTHYRSMWHAFGVL